MRDLCNKPVVSELAGMTLPPIDRSGLIATRRDLHQHPELGFEERRTSGLVAERLQRLGYTVRTGVGRTDRKSTRLNSSHTVISYAVFCLKKKIQNTQIPALTLIRKSRA